MGGSERGREGGKEGEREGLAAAHSSSRVMPLLPLFDRAMTQYKLTSLLI